jgi:hypothetical protein
VQMHYDPRGDAALQRSHVLQEELDLRRLRVLTTQHDDVHKPVGEGVPEQKAKVTGWLARRPPAGIKQ